VAFTEPVVLDVLFAEADVLIALTVELSTTGVVLTASAEVVETVAWATGQTVVPTEMVAVTTLAGQSVIDGAQLVTV
jgi:hypothetical protein